MAVAEKYRSVLINADSQQVYKVLSVITARPSAQDEARVPHKLFGVMAPGEVCSVGRWLEMAVAEIRAAWQAGQLPIVVGGTGMYLKALTEGLSPIPDVPAAVRTEARALFEELGAEAFREHLSTLDPESVDRLEPADRQRLIRAYEVTVATGKPFSAWRQEPRQPALPEARFATVVLAPERDALYGAINARFDAMAEGGALDEVRALEEMALDAALPAMKALGVPELAAHLRGEITLATAIEKAKTGSRNYAKRQLTWLRHQMKGEVLVVEQYSFAAHDPEWPAQDSESPRAKIFAFIDRFLLTVNA